MLIVSANKILDEKLQSNCHSAVQFSNPATNVGHIYLCHLDDSQQRLSAALRGRLSALTVSSSDMREYPAGQEKPIHR